MAFSEKSGYFTCGANWVRKLIFPLFGEKFISGGSGSGMPEARSEFFRGARGKINFENFNFRKFQKCACYGPGRGSVIYIIGKFQNFRPRYSQNTKRSEFKNELESLNLNLKF